MKKAIRYILITLLVILVIIQFIRPAKNLSEDNTHDITTKYSVPENVMTTLKPACYDCHSNHTDYPWYWHIQPVAFFLSGHVDEGKRHLNFSEFTSGAIWRQYRQLDEIAEQVKEGEMPLSSYTLIHKDARLTDAQKRAIENWAEATRKDIEAHNPADSLKRPKR